MQPNSRDRARLVCTYCHAKKIRCDLQDSSTRACRNCQRNSQPCIQRDRTRRKSKPLSSRAQRRGSPLVAAGQGSGSISSPIQSNQQTTLPVQTLATPITTATSASDSQNAYLSPSTTTETGYLASHSVLLSRNTNSASRHLSSPAQQASAFILSPVDATVLPKLLLRQALIDSYFSNLSHAYPVIDRHDMSGPEPSVLLIQAVCLAGSMMRRTGSSKDLELSRDLYEKTKYLIYFNYEPCRLTVLKAMCLLSIWSPNPSNTTSLDGPWHWSGCAIRMAIQLGLHKQSTHGQGRDSECRRRIWWHLFCSDRLQSSCFGRPMAIQTSDFDVAPPALSDFSEPSLQAKAFIEHVKLCKIIGRVSQLLNSGASLNSDESSALKASLCQWIRRLPPELSLYDAVGLRQPYKKEVTSLHLVYFTAIVLLQAAARGYNSQWKASPISLLASSCIARLYEETQLREDVCFLIHIDGFYCMVGAIPLLYWRTRSHNKESCRLEELGILRSTVEQLSTRFGGAGTVLRNMEALETELQQRRSDTSINDMMQVEENIIAGDGEQMEELFPFPPELCPNMDLLSTAGAARMEDSLNITHSFVQDLPEWIFEDVSSFSGIFESEIV